MTPQPPPSAATLAPEHALIIVNCSRSKLITSAPVPALDLYQGACVPQVRQHFADDPARRSRVRILSAAHGLLRADDPVSTYDHQLRSRPEAIRLHQRTVRHQVDAEFAVSPGLRHLVVIVEPLYLLALRRVFDYLDRLGTVSLLPDPRAWPDGLAVLRRWGGHDDLLVRTVVAAQQLPHHQHAQLGSDLGSRLARTHTVRPAAGGHAHGVGGHPGPPGRLLPARRAERAGRPTSPAPVRGHRHRRRQQRQHRLHCRRPPDRQHGGSASRADGRGHRPQPRHRPRARPDRALPRRRHGAAPARDHRHRRPRHRHQRAGRVPPQPPLRGASGWPRRARPLSPARRGPPSRVAAPGRPPTAVHRHHAVRSARRTPARPTHDLVDLGHGRRDHDWDLPRMVVTALVAVPHVAVLEVGGFDAEFGRVGWGMEDTYLGACLIAAGLLVIPLRQAVGFHLDPPDAFDQWQRKLATWPATLARYWDLMRYHPPPTGRARVFTAAMTSLLRSCEVLR